MSLASRFRFASPIAATAAEVRVGYRFRHACLAGAVLHLVAGIGELALGFLGLALLVVALPVLVVAIPALLVFGCIFIGIKVLAAIAC